MNATAWWPSPYGLTFTHIFLHQRGVPVKSSGKLAASRKMPLDDRVSAIVWVRVSRYREGAENSSPVSGGGWEGVA